MLVVKGSSLRSTFQYSIIPCARQKQRASKNFLISANCRNSETLNYLKATDIEVGLLPNFGTKPEVKRKAFDNLRKQFPARHASP